DQLVKSRISADGETLFLATASQVKSTSCAVQIHRVASDGSTFSGPIQTCYRPEHADSKQARSTVHIDDRPRRSSTRCTPTTNPILCTTLQLWFWLRIGFGRLLSKIRLLR
ncbi:hypothetical protein OESDEN_18658, partial [Oesophagostomum dentatum]